MNRVITWIKRQGDQNTVTYSRFGLPGDETDDRPPPTQIQVAPFDELDQCYFLCKKFHVARAALICAGMGMSITLCVFIATFVEFSWYSHKRGVDVLALIGLLLFLICGILTHWHVVVGVKKEHPKYLLPFIVVYVVMITSEGAMGLFGIYHFSLLSSIDVSDHTFQTRSHAYAFRQYHSALTTQVMIGTLIFFAIFLIQGSMLWIILRCRQFLERKLIHKIELAVAEKAKQQYPGIQVVHAPRGVFDPVNGGDVVDVENGGAPQPTETAEGIMNPNHQYESSLPVTISTSPSHRIGVVMDSIGSPPPSYARSQEHEGEQPAAAATPTRTLFASSVE